MSGVGDHGEFTVRNGFGDDLGVFARFKDIFFADDYQSGSGDIGKVGCEIQAGETKQQFEESIEIQALVALTGLAPEAADWRRSSVPKN